MSLQSEIDALVAEVNGALGAVIVDYDGESVITSGEHLPNHDLKVVGAYGGIFLDHLKRIRREIELGPTISFVIEAEESRLLTRVLTNGYFIVLILDRRANLALARHRLERSYARLIHEF